MLSHVQLFTTPWTAAHQAPLSMGFSRQEYWSGVPLPSPAISLKGILFLILTNTGCRGRYYHWLWQPGIRDAKYPASAGQPCTIKKKKNPTWNVNSSPPALRNHAQSEMLFQLPNYPTDTENLLWYPSPDETQPMWSLQQLRSITGISIILLNSGLVHALNHEVYCHSYKKPQKSPQIAFSLPYVLKMK